MSELDYEIPFKTQNKKSFLFRSTLSPFMVAVIIIMLRLSNLAFANYRVLLTALSLNLSRGL